MNVWEIVKYIVLAIVQGISEILPISSSGHLAVLQALFDLDSQRVVVLTLWLHVGSLVALIVYFFPRLWSMVLSLITWTLNCFSRRPSSIDVLRDVHAILYLVLATIPAAIVGLFFGSYLDAIFQNITLIGLSFLVTSGLVFWITTLKRKGSSTYTFRNTMIAGLCQTIGVLPGVSRSGVTLLGGRLAGLTFTASKEWAFLLFLPITAGSFIVDLLNPVSEIWALDGATFALILSATVLSGFVTYITLRLIMKTLEVKHFRWMSVYLLAIGFLTLAYSFIG